MIEKIINETKNKTCSGTFGYLWISSPYVKIKNRNKEVIATTWTISLCPSPSPLVKVISATKDKIIKDDFGLLNANKIIINIGMSKTNCSNNSSAIRTEKDISKK